jgi:PadR family transcriptional regulator PadR
MYWYIVLRGSRMDRAWSSQLKKGAVELCILASLREGEAYGYQLLQRLARNPLLATTESTLYPIVTRLAAEKLVAVRQAPSPTGPPRRYYRITALGQVHLNQLIEYWRDFNGAVSSLLSQTSTGEPL